MEKYTDKQITEILDKNMPYEEDKKACYESIISHSCMYCCDYGYRCPCCDEAWALGIKYKVIFTCGEK